MMFEQRRRSSAGLFFAAISAAALAAAPAVVAAPASSASSVGRTAPDIYENASGFWQNKLNPPRHVPPKKGSKQSSTETKRSKIKSRSSKERILKARQGYCLDSTYTEDDINTLLWSGGAGTVVQLCPGAVITTQGPIIMNAANQEISTQGYPSTNRGKLVVGGSDQDVMIYANCNACTGVALKNIEIDGSRPALGHMSNGAAIVEMGGDTTGQVVSNCHMHHPRGWSAFHLIEGANWQCSGASITGSNFGPAGIGPNSAQQFRRSLTEYRDYIAPRSAKEKRQANPPGQWADGMSIACANTVITGNTILGATDGGIVLFGAPNSRITGNTIIAQGENCLGGVNLVDHGPWNGQYGATLIDGNYFIAGNAMMKIGVAMGLMTWGGYNNSDFRTSGGIVTNNWFIANGGNGYFGYGIANAGHNNGRYSGNDFSRALFGGVPSSACVPGWTPPPQAIVYDPYSTSGSIIQPDVTTANTIGFLICMMPCAYDSTCAASPNVKPVSYVAASSSLTSSSASTASKIATSSSSSTKVTTSTKAPTSTSTNTATQTGVWLSSNSATTIAITTASLNSRCGAGGGTRTICASPTASCVSSKGQAYSTCAGPASTSSSASTTPAPSTSTLPSGVWYSTASSTTIMITTASASSRCGAAFGTRTVCASPTAACVTAQGKGYSTCSVASTSTSTSTKTGNVLIRSTSTTSKRKVLVKSTDLEDSIAPSPTPTSQETLPSGMWYSTAESTTIVISTASEDERCGAAFGTRTVCASSTAACVSVGSGYSTCSGAPASTPTPTSTRTLPSGMWYSTASSTTIVISTASVNGRCGAAFGTRTVCETPIAACQTALGRGYSTCSAAPTITTVTSGSVVRVESISYSTSVTTITQSNTPLTTSSTIVPITSTSIVSSAASPTAATVRRGVRRGVVHLAIPVEDDVYTAANKSAGESSEIEADWLSADGVQPFLTYEEASGFDKRQVLADDGYWSD